MWRQTKAWAMRLHRTISAAVVCSIALCACGESDSARRERHKKTALDRKTAILSRYAAALPFDTDEAAGPFSAPLTISQQDEIAQNPKRLYWFEESDFDWNLDIYREKGDVRLVRHGFQDRWLSIGCEEPRVHDVVQTMRRGKNFTKTLFIFTLKSVSPIRAKLEAVGSGEDLRVEAADLKGRLYEGELVEAVVLDEGEILDNAKEQPP